MVFLVLEVCPDFRYPGFGGKMNLAQSSSLVRRFVPVIAEFP